MSTAILMISPVHFAFNQQTAATNSFQKEDPALDAQNNALREFNGLVQVLREAGVEVLVYKDTPEPHTPDSIFPNNWISTHPLGILCLYPMCNQNRRQERRPDIIADLKAKYGYQTVFDFTPYEIQNRFLEGTGSIVIDEENKTAYAVLSPRTEANLFEQWARTLGYRAIAFQAHDLQKKPIYHTNVVMASGQKFIAICLECIPFPDRAHVEKSLAESKKTILNLSIDQMNHFAGNMLEVPSKNGGRVIAMSDAAYTSLDPEQLALLKTFGQVVHSPIPTIEALGGGSVRCMLAEIHGGLK